MWHFLNFISGIGFYHFCVRTLDYCPPFPRSLTPEGQSIFCLFDTAVSAGAVFGTQPPTGKSWVDQERPPSPEAERRFRTTARSPRGEPKACFAGQSLGMKLSGEIFRCIWDFCFMYIS